MESRKIKKFVKLQVAIWKAARMTRAAAIKAMSFSLTTT
jgi:hypothetical protein